MNISRIKYVPHNKFQNIKGDIFKGKIISFSEYPSLLRIRDIFTSYFFSIFKMKFDVSLLKSFIIKNPADENKLVYLQDKIRNCKLIRTSLMVFFKEINLNLKDLYIDEITLRYSPKEGHFPSGKLKPTNAHRDTWASNIFHQINWWIPMHSVFSDNSIYIIPRYFKRKVDNNSKNWAFKKYKTTPGYPSVPTTDANFESHEKLNVELDSHEMLCFSGNHIHGSNVGRQLRFNIETRTVSSNDPKNFKIPMNIDSSCKIVKKNWFKNMVTGKCLG